MVLSQFQTVLILHLSFPWGGQHFISSRAALHSLVLCKISRLIRHMKPLSWYKSTAPMLLVSQKIRGMISSLSLLIVLLQPCYKVLFEIRMLAALLLVLVFCCGKTECLGPTKTRLNVCLCLFASSGTTQWPLFFLAAFHHIMSQFFGEPA